MTRVLARSALTAVLVLGSIGSASAVLRTGWIPSAEYVARAYGDLWTFACPAGGTFTVTVDNVLEVPGSNLDLVANVYDADGTFLDGGDDEIACSHPACAGFQCPAIVDAPCGETSPHSVFIFSGLDCAVGGGYVLNVTVKDKNGNSLPDSKVKLGGGANRKLPPSVNKAFKPGPALDDERNPYP
jgi:hypothetical protein